MPIVHVLALYLVTAQVLCNEHGSLEHEIPRRSFLSRRAIDGTRGRKYFDPEDAEGAFDSYGSAGGQYDPYEEKTDLSDIRRNVPGEPGVDYPAYTTLPQTGFTCEGRSRGYYADEDAGCQVFHVCHDVLVSSFLCPIGSTFSQKLLTCDWWTKVDCSATRKFIEINRNSYQVDDDEMIRKAYAMISLQSGKDLTRDGLVDPDRSGRVFDFVTIDSTGNDVPSEYEDYNGVQRYSTNYDDYRSRLKTKTSPSYQNTFHSRAPQKHRHDNSPYQDSPVIHISKFDESRAKDVSGNKFNQFQPSYAPTVPTVTTTTRRFYSPTVPTTFRPSTVSYDKLDLAFDSSDHLFSHSKEYGNHVTLPTITFKSGRNEDRHRHRLREEDFYDEDEKMAESVEKQTYALSNATGREYYSFDKEDIETRESIGLAHALGGSQKNKLLQRDPTEEPKALVSAWTGAPILTNDSDRSETSAESTKLSGRNHLNNTANNSNYKNEETNEESADFYEPDIGGTTTASYESQEIASTQESRTLQSEELTLRPTTTVEEKYFNVKNGSDEVPGESSTKRYENSRDRFVEFEFSQSDNGGEKGIPSKINSRPSILQSSEFLNPAENKFRINVPDRPSSQIALFLNRYPSTTGSYSTIEATENPNFTTTRSVNSGISINSRSATSSENSTNPENAAKSGNVNPTTSAKGPRFHSTIRIDVHQAESLKNSRELFPTIGNVRYNFDPKKEISKDGQRTESDKIISDQDAGLSRDFVVDLPISDIVPPIVDYNDGYDDFLAPNEELVKLQEKTEAVNNNTEVKLLSKYNTDLKFTIRGAETEKRGQKEERGKEIDDQSLSATLKPLQTPTVTATIEETESNYDGKVIPFREGSDRMISPESHNIFTSTSSAGAFASTSSSNIYNTDPFDNVFTSTPPSGVSRDEILLQQNFRSSETPNSFNLPSTINSFDFVRSIVTSYDSDDGFTTKNPATLRPFSSQGSVERVKHSDFTTEDPFDGAAKAGSSFSSSVPPNFGHFTVGSTGLNKLTLGSSVSTQNPLRRDEGKGTTVNPVQFINNADISVDQGSHGQLQSFNHFNKSDNLSIPRNFNDSHNENSEFSSTSKPTPNAITNFNRVFVESTTLPTLVTFGTPRNLAENDPTSKMLSAELKDPNTAMEDSKKSSVTQRSVVVQARKENSDQVEPSTPRNLFQELRLETLKEIEDTIEHNKSPYQVSLIVNKDDGSIPGDDFIARLIAQHEKRNFSNDRNDDFEIIRSVDPEVLSENTGTSLGGNYDHAKDDDHNLTNDRQNHFQESAANYGGSNIQGSVSDQGYNFNSSAIGYDNLRNNSTSKDYRNRDNHFDTIHDGRQNDPFNNESNNYNNNYSDKDYQAQLNGRDRDYNYTVSVTNSTSIKIGNHPQEFKRDSKLSTLSLLQLMAELLKIDRLPRPFALQGTGTIDVETESESSPKVVDLRAQLAHNREVPNTSQRPTSKNLESVGLLSRFDPGTSTSYLDSAELRTRSAQSPEILDLILNENRNLKVGSNLENVEIRNRGNSKLNNAPTTTHRSLLIPLGDDNRSNKTESHSTESLKASASRNLRPLKKEEILEQLAENFGQPIYKIDRRPIFDLPDINRNVDFRTGLAVVHEEAAHPKLTVFEENQRAKPLKSDTKDANIERLKVQNYEREISNERFQSTFKDKTSNSDFKYTSTVSPSFEFTSPNFNLQVTNFDSIEKLSKLKPNLRDIHFGESLKPTPLVTTTSPRLTTTSTMTTTEPSKTIVKTEFVPSIGFSFDTDEGREEYVEAVLGGLIHGPREEKSDDSRGLEAKNDTGRV